MVDLIFVRTVNIPNIPLLPCLDGPNIFILTNKTNATGIKPNVGAAPHHKNLSSLIKQIYKVDTLYLVYLALVCSLQLEG